MEENVRRSGKHLKNWFIRIGLIQFIIWILAAIWFAAEINNKVANTSAEVILVKEELRRKADLSMLLQIKNDMEQSQKEIKVDLRYIRERVDMIADKK